jgi:hypothetical protein
MGHIEEAAAAATDEELQQMLIYGARCLADAEQSPGSAAASGELGRDTIDGVMLEIKRRAIMRDRLSYAATAGHFGVGLTRSEVAEAIDDVTKGLQNVMRGRGGPTMPRYALVAFDERCGPVRIVVEKA